MHYGQVIKFVNIAIIMLILEMLIVVILMIKESVHTIIVIVLKVKVERKMTGIFSHLSIFMNYFIV